MPPPEYEPAPELLQDLSSWLQCSRVALLALVICVTGTLLSEVVTGLDPAEQENEQIFLEAFQALQALNAEGQFAEAEQAARELLQALETKASSEPLRVTNVMQLLVEALWRGGNASDAETLTIADRLVRIREDQLGANHPLVADGLLAKGIVLRERSDYSEAEALFLQALEIFSATLGPEDLSVADAHKNLGKLYERTAQYDRARDHLEKAVELYEASAGGGGVLLADALNSLAVVLTYRGERAEAEAGYRRALAIKEELLGTAHPSVATTLHNLGYFLATADPETARSLIGRAIAIREAVLGPEHPLTGQSVTNLAMIDGGAGFVEAADENWRRSVSIQERALGADHPSTAIALANYAVFLKGRADYLGAERNYQRALATFERAFVRHHPRVVWVIEGLAELQLLRGNLDEAQKAYERALRLLDEDPDRRHFLVNEALTGLGNVALKRGRFEEARRFFERAVALAEEEFGATEDENVGRSKLRVAKALLRQGDYREAALALEQVVEIEQLALHDEHPHMIEVLTALGDLKAQTGECAEAMPLYRQTLRILDKVYGPDSPEIGEVSLKLARCQASAGASEAAIGSALDAERISRNHLRLILTGLPESEGLRYAATRPSGLDLAFSLLVRDRTLNAKDELFDALIRSRALVLDEIGERHRTAMESADPAIAGKVKVLRDARSRLAHLTVQGPPDEVQPDAYRAMLYSARADRDWAERELARTSLTSRLRQERRDTGLQQIREVLPPAAALVSFARFSQVDLSGAVRADRQQPDGEPSYLAFVLPAEGRAPTVIPLGRAQPIDDLVKRIRKRLSQAAEAPPWATEQAEANYRRDADALRALVWDPLEPPLENAETLFVVPDGPLHLINLMALPVAETAYLIDHAPRTHYLSAERDLVAGGAEADGKGLFALGDPAFDDADVVMAQPPEPEPLLAQPLRTELDGAGIYRGPRSACDSFQSMHFEELPSTEQELADVVELWQRSLPASAEDSGPGAVEEIVLLSREGASEAAFKTGAPGRRILHVATHGFFLGGECRSKSHRAGSSETLENPLLLAGLAMAGANQRDAADPEQDDGILTAEEVASLDLASVEWAVLSACDTGIGEVLTGEGVFGLRRAFSVAGARTLIMSLWRVEDEPTRDWMKLLYEHRFVDGLATVEAVHRASLELLHRRREEGLSTHPFYWGGFVAAGDWR